jgi:DNA-binding PadR family transcriptional regulator
MINRSEILRGLTDTIILSQLLNSDSYGYEINKTLVEKTDSQFELKEATLYTSFRRLEEIGAIQSYWGDEKSGARRRYYTITESGRRLFAENKTDWKAIVGIVNKICGEENE